MKRRDLLALLAATQRQRAADLLVGYSEICAGAETLDRPSSHRIGPDALGNRVYDGAQGQSYGFGFSVELRIRFTKDFDI
jgi:hypothetical protein